MIPVRAPRLSRLRLPLLALPAVALLSSCNSVVMNPDGDIARQQANLILIATVLMLLIIIPVMCLTVLFAWRYRQSNRDAEYQPDWDHSTKLELVIWSAPLAIIIALGAITWVSTHLLDPFRPLDRIAPGKPVAPGTRPLEIEVVSLDWKWLFIYPEQGVATVNELALPVDRPVRFKLTSSSVMNTFYVPTLAGMIYTMPGMQTQLNAVLNKPGQFEGKSANYSGAGFSYMNFPVKGLDAAGFDRWVAETRAAAGGAKLDSAEYLKLEVPSERVPVMRYASVDAGLFARVLNMCVRPNTPCMADTMHRDMQRRGEGHGHGHPPVNDTAQPVPGEPEGALMQHPSEHQPSPHLSAPHGEPAGRSEPGSDANRNMTRNDIPARPGHAPVVRS